MIKLSLPEKPIELTSELEDILKEEFLLNSKDPVWKKNFIKEAVFNITNGKCAYSEVKLREEGKDMQIDHFFPKSIYPNKIVEWGNLLPSLNHCNRSKKDKDPNIIDIVNPLEDNPKDYFYFIGSRLYCKNEKGKTTRDTFKLNDEFRLNNPRMNYLKEIGKTLKDIEPWFEKDIHRFTNRLMEIMSKGTRSCAYSAAVSTYILQNVDYISYKKLLTEEGIWDSEFQELERELEFCSLPRPLN